MSRKESGIEGQRIEGRSVEAEAWEAKMNGNGEKGLGLQLPVPDKLRPKMYEKIANVHRQIVEAKWRSRTARQPFSLKPKIVLHLEESLAFLAEELLVYRALVDSLMTSVEVMELQLHNAGISVPLGGEEDQQPVKMVGVKPGSTVDKVLKREAELLKEDHEAMGGNLEMMKGVATDAREEARSEDSGD